MSSKCAVRLCPLRPSSEHEDIPDEEGWDSVGESNVLAAPQLGPIGSAETHEEVGDDGDSYSAVGESASNGKRQRGQCRPSKIWSGL